MLSEKWSAFGVVYILTGSTDSFLAGLVKC
jgi:hypothetical protein